MARATFRGIADQAWLRHGPSVQQLEKNLRRVVPDASKRELRERYAAQTGTDVQGLEWFVALALWKAAVFCEAIYGRYVRGELAAGDDAAAVFEETVPRMAASAAASLDSSGA